MFLGSECEVPGLPVDDVGLHASIRSARERGEFLLLSSDLNLSFSFSYTDSPLKNDFETNCKPFYLKFPP